MLGNLFRAETSTLQDPSDELWDALCGPQSAAGKVVTADTAMRVAAVYACVRILSETVAALPFNLYQKTAKNNREVASKHPLQMLLHDLPNEEMTSMDFRTQLMAALQLRGNAFSEVERDRAGRVHGVWPINPDKVWVGRSEKTKRLSFEIHDGDMRTLTPQRMWRVAGLSTNGIIGLSPISQAREGIGLSLALEEHGARLFSNGAKPGGVLQVEGKLSDPAYARLRKSWSDRHQGGANAHRVAILEEGTKWNQIGMSSEDAQFLESRKYQRSEIASMFGVPPHMIADLEKATFSNIEHQSIQFVVYSLLPWLKRIEQSIFRDLLSPVERREYYAKHSVEGLLRGDSKSRSEFYKNLFNSGAISINDMRRLENMNSIDGGDQHWLQLAMAPITQSREPSSSGSSND
ncbi:phage portal protein [uncultured Microbulbifer sp.]|uniref:phage portal protein n=1 Tax=uncultured Microbulbifer sp. TaxID=348147 RepID=UPI00260CCA3B|nr:phage portal protein [uncultured Microbulbifer sp.]